MPLSDEELARYEKLCAYLTLKDHSEGLPTIRLHWGDPTPQEAIEPEPTADMTLERPIAALPVPAPEPVADGDDETDVDAELADLLAQLQRRLGR